MILTKEQLDSIKFDFTQKFPRGWEWSEGVVGLSVRHVEDDKGVSLCLLSDTNGETNEIYIGVGYSGIGPCAEGVPFEVMAAFVNAVHAAVGFHLVGIPTRMSQPSARTEVAGDAITPADTEARLPFALKEKEDEK